MLSLSQSLIIDIGAHNKKHKLIPNISALLRNLINYRKHNQFEDMFLRINSQSLFKHINMIINII